MVTGMSMRDREWGGRGKRARSERSETELTGEKGHDA